jgi:hypothetical protein
MTFGILKRAARASISRRAIVGSPGTAGLTWNVDSCSVTAITAQMFDVFGGSLSASNAANISTAQPSALGIFAGISRAISARATSGSIAGSRGRCEPVHAASMKKTAAHSPTRIVPCVRASPQRIG